MPFGAIARKFCLRPFLAGCLAQSPQTYRQSFPTNRRTFPTNRRTFPTAVQTDVTAGVFFALKDQPFLFKKINSILFLTKLELQYRFPLKPTVGKHKSSSPSLFARSSDPRGPYICQETKKNNVFWPTPKVLTPGRSRYIYIYIILYLPPKTQNFCFGGGVAYIYIYIQVCNCVTNVIMGVLPLFPPFGSQENQKEQHLWGPSNLPFNPSADVQFAVFLLMALVASRTRQNEPLQLSCAAVFSPANLKTR